MFMGGNLVLSTVGWVCGISICGLSRGGNGGWGFFPRCLGGDKDE